MTKLPLIDRIQIVGAKGQDLNPSLVERLKATAAAKYLAADPEDDLWAGDGYLVPTRSSTDGIIVYIYVPEEN